MAAFFTGILIRIMGFLMTPILIWTVPVHLTKTIAPVDQANMRLQFSVISDVHMESLTYARYSGFARALSDIAASKKKQDALILLGDNTMNGQPYEYTMLYGILSQYNKTSNTLLALGNHDMNRTVYTKETAHNRFKTYYQAYTGTKLDKPYYSKEINGYTFIVMGDEGPQPDGAATISDAQLKWLDSTLKAASGKGKPIFVFNHQPLLHTFPNWGWGGVGKQSGEIRYTLKKYSNVFFFSGHLHTKATQLTIQQKEGVTFVDVPTLLSNEPTGVGYQVEVYDNQVLLRARNYITGEWWRDANQYTIPLATEISASAGLISSTGQAIPVTDGEPLPIPADIP